MDKCKNCQYFAKDLKAGVNNGLCKLNPPVPIAIIYPQGVNITMVYPVINIDDHCGQFVQGINKTISMKYPEA